MSKGFNVSEIMRALSDEVSRELEDTGNRTVTALVLSTPVGDPSLWTGKAPAGYQPGHARHNWHSSIGVKSTGEIPGVDPVGSAIIAREEKFIKRWAKDKKRPALHIQNNVPYIERLNDGWSSQAPAGFVEKAILAANGISTNERKLLK